MIAIASLRTAPEAGCVQIRVRARCGTSNIAYQQITVLLIDLPVTGDYLLAANCCQTCQNDQTAWQGQAVPEGRRPAPYSWAAGRTGQRVCPRDEEVPARCRRGDRQSHGGDLQCPIAEAAEQEVHQGTDR